MKGKILLLIIPILFSCSTNKEQEDVPVIPHHDYQEVKDLMIKWEDVFNHEEENYAVYFYLPTCKYCETIKDEVIDIALTHETKIYFCSDKENIRIDEDAHPKELLGISQIDYLSIVGFPTVFQITHHETSDGGLGYVECIDLIRKLS